jgi:DNA replication protein DnaC
VAKETIIYPDTGNGWEVVELDGKQITRRSAKYKDHQSERLITQAMIPARYTEKSFEDFERGHMAVNAALSVAQHFISTYPVVDKGLLLYGPPGTGKTHLAIAVLKKAIQKTNINGLFVDYREFIRTIQDSFNSSTATTSKDIIKPVLEAELLVMDEIGALKPTEWVLDTITYIINNRYTENKITIFTTNFEVDSSKIESRRNDRETARKDREKELKASLSGSQLSKALKHADFGHLSGNELDNMLENKIGFRLMSRLHEMCDFIPLEGAPDYRIANK